MVSRAQQTGGRARTCTLTSGDPPRAAMRRSMARNKATTGMLAPRQIQTQAGPPLATAEDQRQDDEQQAGRERGDTGKVEVPRRALRVGGQAPPSGRDDRSTD